MVYSSNNTAPIHCISTGTIVAYAMTMIIQLVMFLYSYNTTSIVVQVVDIVVDEDRNRTID